MEKEETIRSKVQEFYDKIKELSEKLELNDTQLIIGIEPKDNIKLGGNLERNSVFIVKIKEENGDVNQIVIDADMNVIANIDKDGKIKLSDREKQIWEKHIGKEGQQTPSQKSLYDFDKDYYLEEYITNKNIQKNENKDNKENKDKKVQNKEENDEQKAAESLNIDRSAIISMIKIEDRENFGQAINQKLNSDTYIARYGNNKTKIMQQTSDGKLKEVSGLESSEFNLEVLNQLNMDKSRKNQKIKAGDLTTIKTEDNKYNYVVVREKDPQKRNSN